MKKNFVKLVHKDLIIFKVDENTDLFSSCKLPPYFNTKIDKIFNLNGVYIKEEPTIQLKNKILYCFSIRYYMYNENNQKDFSTLPQEVVSINRFYVDSSQEFEEWMKRLCAF
jgi:hypothetical protein